MSKMLKQAVKQGAYVYRGFGFPVVLMGVPMVKAMGVLTPDIKLNALELELRVLLANKPSRLTGAEVRFLRQSYNLTLQQFAERFGVTHPAVIKWERARQKPSGMAWATEKDIRLYVLEQQKAKPEQFVTAYRKLEKEPTARPGRITIDASDVA